MNEYALPTSTLVVGVPLIVGARFARRLHGDRECRSDADALPSLTLMTMFV